MNKSVNIIFLIFIIFAPLIFGQTRSDAIKRQATLLMQEGRFKESVDQLNKYITSNPHQADGYHLRGLCFEKTTEYQYSVLDLRRARRLDPNDLEIKKDLDRVLAVWHDLLYRKIEGHKRDIAIDPNYPFSYLEIGKSYRWLEEWNNAEIWYDQYLKRDDNASPDEIIRYTEILAKTGSITKGERILKVYVERYPEDWRLWSRYGYFTLWLGKYKIAENAFTKALGFKPFFKEAEDGLDLARNQAYMVIYQPRAFEKVYPIDRYYNMLNKTPDNPEIRFNLIEELITANRYEEAFQQLQYLQFKFSEDERYKSLYKTVSEYRDSTLNKNVEQYTEALKSNPNDKESVIKLAETYSYLFYYDSAIEVLEEYLQNVPEDQGLDARFRLAQYSAWNYEWEKAISILNKLLAIDPENLDYQLLRGQIAVWTVLDFDIAENYLLNVVNKRPDNIDAYISLASMYSWKKNFPEARKHLDVAKSLAPFSPEVEGAESNYALHLSAYEEQKIFEIRQEAGKLAEQGDCYGALEKFDEYKSKRTALTKDELNEYADIATCAEVFSKAIWALDQILSTEFDYEIALKRARNYYYSSDTAMALNELESLSTMKPNDQKTLLYLADTYLAVDQVEKSELIFRAFRYSAATPDEREVLEDDFDYYTTDNFEEYLKEKDFLVQSDSLFLLDMKKPIDQRMIFLGDTYSKLKMPETAEEIYDEILETSSFEDVKEELEHRKIYLADAFAINEEYGKAKDLYYDVLESTTDTSQIRLINQRISWIPPYGIGKGIAAIGRALYYFVPTNVGLAPFSNYYRDNQDLSLWNYGVRIDAGFVGFLGLGGSWTRTRIRVNTIQRDLTSIRGVASIFFSQNLSLSGSFGLLTIPGESSKYVGDGTVRYIIPEVLSLSAYYDNNDTRLILYSPTLIFTRMKTDLYRFSGNYQYRNLLKFSTVYSYYKNSDKNYGNDFQFRLGRKFFEDGIFGYEFFFSDFAFISPTYYSPQEFYSHSLWTEIKWKVETNITIMFGGKLGYVPEADFVISEIFGDILIKPFSNLNIQGRIGYSNSFRYDSSYKSISGQISAYWGVF